MRPAVKGLVIRQSGGRLRIKLPSGLVVNWPDKGKFEYGDCVMVLYDRNESVVHMVEPIDLHKECLLDEGDEPPDEKFGEYENDDELIDDLPEIGCRPSQTDDR